jgi:PAS domain S-box-containing protein
MADAPPPPGPVPAFPPLLALESIRDAFYVVDADWRIVFFNANAERHFGRARGEVLGRSVFEVFPTASGSAFEAPFRDAMRGRTGARVEAGSVSGDGRWVEVEVAPCGDGLSVQVRDVTERKRIETLLREREAGLAEADRRKDEFLAVLSHELRNPLAPLTNALRLLERSPAIGEHERTLLAIAQRQRAQLVRLVDDLLDVSRVTRGKVALHPGSVRVADALRDAIESVAPAARERALHVETSLPDAGLTIVADPARLAQILGNLLHNAVRYARRSGTVRVVATPLGADVRIDVEDDGAGIAAADLPRLFEPFVQLDAGEHRAAGGLGIGLALVKRLAELHGGTAFAASPGPGRGATFSVTLPRAGPAADPPAADPPGTGPLTPPSTAPARPGARSSDP